MSGEKCEKIFNTRNNKVTKRKNVEGKVRNEALSKEISILHKICISLLINTFNTTFSTNFHRFRTIYYLIENSSIVFNILSKH